MDRLERQEELSVLLREALAGWQSGMWTALPAIVQSYNAAKTTCTAQPAIKFEQLLPDGSWSPPANMPLLEDVPIVFPAGGGFALTFPLAKGDEVLVIIASRCIDVWWQNGGIQPQARPRMHDLSDAFAIPGPFSQPRKLSPAPAAGVTQLRNADGTVLVEVGPAGGKLKGDWVIEGNLNLSTADNLTVGGTIHAGGAIIAGFGGVDQVGLQTHTHPSNGTPPTPGT